jgi:hypothetical protein
MSEEKPNWYERYAARVKALDRKIFAPFYRTKFGSRWLAFDESLNTRKYGKLIRIALIFVIVFGMNFGVRAIVSTAVAGSNDFNLTQEQKDAGFAVTVEKHVKFDVPDDVANRFFSDSEEQATQDCTDDAVCWDFKLIPLKKNCETMHVTMQFFETDNLLASPIDQVDKDFKPEISDSFRAGSVYDYRLGTDKEKALYAVVDRAYCKTYSGN